MPITAHRVHSPAPAGSARPGRPARHTRWHHALAVAMMGTALALPLTSRAHEPSADLSLASTLPVAVSVTAPVAVLSAGTALTVVAVEASADGTVWVLERASDGARVSLRFTGRVIKGGASGIGAVARVSVIATGTVISVGSEAICFIPNEIGAGLLYNERVSR